MERRYSAEMRRAVLVSLGICLLAVVVFGSIKVFDHYEGDGRSPYEKLEDEAEQERAEGKDTFPLPTPASRERFVALYCLYMARSEDQLRRCSRRPARDVYRSNDNEYAWLFASEVIAYCDRRSSAGRFCDPANVKAPIQRIEALVDR
jgi:hypothetical protein